MKTLSVRIDDSLEQLIQYITEKRKIIDKSAYIRELLDKSLRKELLDYLCSMVQEGQITAWKAAEIAHISLRVMLDQLAARNISTYTLQMWEEDLRYAMEL